MTSLLTNSAAMVALATLSDINNNLSMTNNRVSTGLRIAQASDSAAYWAIATTTRSDNGALSTVEDALAIGKATLEVANSGLDSVRESLQTVKELLVAARQPGVERGNIQTQISGLITDAIAQADASVINEQNYLSIDTSDADYNATKSVVASFERAAGGAVSVSTIDIDVETVALVDANATAADKDGILDKQRSTVAGVDGIFDTADDFFGPDGVTGGGDDVAPSFITIASLGTGNPVGALTDSTADMDTLDGFIRVVDAAIVEVITAQNTVGVNIARTDSQLDFVSALRDANDRAVGALVDANMEEESTKLRALQTQQQLAVQSLAIANTSSQNILALFG